MRKSLFLFVICFLSGFTLYAQGVASIMNKVVNTFNVATDISADFFLSSSQMNINGSIVMKGVKYRIISDGYMCWYDGKIQWVYNSATKEVNIIEPTLEEVETSNPYLAVMHYKTKYRSLLKSSNGNNYSVELIAIDPAIDMYHILLTINKTTNLISEAVVTTTDDVAQTIKFTNYKKNENISSDIFVFDSKMVPKGTPVIDLR